MLSHLHCWSDDCRVARNRKSGLSIVRRVISALLLLEQAAPLLRQALPLRVVGERRPRGSPAVFAAGLLRDGLAHCAVPRRLAERRQPDVPRALLCSASRVGLRSRSRVTHDWRLAPALPGSGRQRRLFAARAERTRLGRALLRSLFPPNWVLRRFRRVHR